MAIDISSLRSRRAATNAAIAANFSDKGQKTNYDDDRYWKLEAGKDGNAAALIRFLDLTPETEDGPSPFIQIWKYGFKTKGRWYIERSLQTIGQDDPVYDMNGELWKMAQGNKDSPYAKQAKHQRRVSEYHANIRVIKDPANPENNGKVFLFKFGTQIFEKITAKISPSDQDVAVGAVSVPIFDYWDGVNFRITRKTEMVDFGQGNKPTPSYKTSTFEDSPSPVAETDEEIVAIAEQQHSLAELIAPKTFKSYEKLQERLEWVLTGKDSKPSEDGGGDDSGNGGGEDPTPAQETATEPAQAATEPSEAPVAEDAAPAPQQEEEEASEYLRKLMNPKT